MGKITIERETLERAITALTYHQNQTRPIERTRISLDALRAALAAQQAEPQEPVASYWLIECKNGFTGWYTGRRLDCRFFDTDHRKAYKFASKELAENEISERGHSCMIATEHVDIAAPPAEPQEPVAWRHSKTGRLYDSVEEVPLADGDEWAEPLYATPATQQAPAAWRQWSTKLHDWDYSTNRSDLRSDTPAEPIFVAAAQPAPAAVPTDSPAAVEYIAERLAFDSGVRWRDLSNSVRNAWRDIARKKRLDRIAAGDKP